MRRLAEGLLGAAICSMFFSAGFLWRKPAEVIFRHMETTVSCQYIGQDGAGVVTRDRAGNLTFRSGPDTIQLSAGRAFLAEDYPTLSALLFAINETKDWRCRMIGDAR